MTQSEIWRRFVVAQLRAGPAISENDLYERVTKTADFMLAAYIHRFDTPNLDEPPKSS